MTGHTTIRFRLSLFVMSIACLMQSPTLSAQSFITPEPVDMRLSGSKGVFTLNASTSISTSADILQPSVDFLQSYLQQFFGFTLKKSAKTGTSIVLSLEVDQKEPAGAYHLSIRKDKILIKAASPEGVFYGIQSLIQVLPAQPNASLAVPMMEVYDYPRFGYRGMHLDVARHFFPVSFVKQYIDYLALYKFNTFHWHLTEDQGWRIEIKKYPRLTEVGGWRNGTIIGRYPGKGNDGIRYGGFYTQEEIKEVVRYAAARYITIIPEIDIPGHSSAAIAAYPQLSCFPNEDTKVPTGAAWNGPTAGKQVQQTWGVFEDVLCPSEYTFQFFQDVFDEVMALFPSSYIHIGGDECPKESWKRSEFCQQLMKEKKLKDEHELQSYFIQRIEKYLNSKGRKIIGWDEILEGGLAPNATVMSWTGEKGGIEAAKQNHTVVMTPGNYVYFDHAQSKSEDSVTIGGFTPLDEVYGYEPIPAELPTDKHAFILGAQANVWTEYMSNIEKVQYMVFPRITALSEVLWSPRQKRNWASFEKKIPGQFEKFQLWGINASRAYFKTPPTAARPK